SLNPENMSNTRDFKLELLRKTTMVLLGIFIFLLLEHTLELISKRMNEKIIERSKPVTQLLPIDAGDEVAKSELEIDSRAVAQRKDTKPLCSAPPVIWMIILGDSFHNFMDGLAIGTAFVSQLRLGLFLSISVFCEEFPHELGDFAILLNAGLSVKKALILNVISALSAYLGLILGVLWGDLGNVQFYVFAFTAGVFVFISLGHMLPELLHQSQSLEVSAFIITCSGLLIGFCCIICMALLSEFYFVPSV
ncbi:hypothetical protein Ciccas_011047, partial [Cichlidogyrus casuarinus]